MGAGGCPISGSKRARFLVVQRPLLGPLRRWLGQGAFLRSKVPDLLVSAGPLWPLVRPDGSKVPIPRELRLVPDASVLMEGGERILGYGPRRSPDEAGGQVLPMAVPSSVDSMGALARLSALVSFGPPGLVRVFFSPVFSARVLAPGCELLPPKLLWNPTLPGPRRSSLLEVGHNILRLRECPLIARAPALKRPRSSCGRAGEREKKIRTYCNPRSEVNANIERRALTRRIVVGDILSLPEPVAGLDTPHDGKGKWETKLLPVLKTAREERKKDTLPGREAAGLAWFLSLYARGGSDIRAGIAGRRSGLAQRSVERYIYRAYVRQRFSAFRGSSRESVFPRAVSPSLEFRAEAPVEGLHPWTVKSVHCPTQPQQLRIRLSSALAAFQTILHSGCCLMILLVCWEIRLSSVHVEDKFGQRRGL
nr:hypothetical protein Iba_chr11bCG15420 [Ipomoea batatas]